MAWNNTHSIDLERDSSQYLSRSNDAYDITVGTFECWFKLESLPSVAGGIYTIADTSNNSGSQGFFILINNTNNKITIGFGAGTGTATSTTTFAIGTWYHVAFAWNTSGTSLIINGISESTGGAATLAAGNASLRIGNDTSSGGTRLLDGIIDDVRIWNIKRTAANVLADYLTVLAGNESGLLSYWKLDNALTDSTSGARTLTNNGAAVFTTDTKFATTTNTEVAGTTVDTFSSWGIAFTASDVAGTTVESSKVGFGNSNLAKNTSTWINQSKS